MMNRSATNLKHLMMICIALTAVCTANARTLTVGLDLSGSNPLVTNKPFAEAAASFVGRQVARSKLGDIVAMRSFGDRGLSNLPVSMLQITRSHRPARVSRMVQQAIVNIPASGITAQSYTNIVAFLEFREFDCENSGTIILITDGIESSSYVDADAFMTGEAALPEPEPDILKGCSVVFYGLGVEREPETVKIIRDAWKHWVGQAGASFEAVIL